MSGTEMDMDEVGDRIRRGRGSAVKSADYGGRWMRSV